MTLCAAATAHPSPARRLFDEPPHRPPAVVRCLAPAAAARVFVVSDLHADYPENMAWLHSLPHGGRNSGDAIVVAGDVAETRAGFVTAMAALRERFGTVFFVPGNHDLWLRREDGRFMDSLEKLTALLDACSELGVETTPRTIGGLGIIPLYSWYHKSFDNEKDITGFRIPPLQMACKDFHTCKWSEELASGGDTALARYFDKLNERNDDAIEDVLRNSNQIMTFSHFVPRQELCPEKRMLFYPNLPKIIGSTFLEKRLRSIHGRARRSSPCHLFGHTHFIWDAVVDRIRYVQAPLAYPRERKRRKDDDAGWLPFCIYHGGASDNNDGNFAARISPAFWSEYYDENERDPDNTELAPWVARFYTKSAQ